MTLDEVAGELYAGLPADFVQRRDEAARSAQTAGDRVLAGVIGKLRKPTVGAWLANLLAHRHPQSVAELVALGAELRTAQQELDATAMRELGRKRQQLVRDLVTRATGTAGDLGDKAGGPAVQELEATLTAAVADPDAAAQLVAGRLTNGLSYAGFGAFGSTPAGPKATTKPRTKAKPAARDKPDRRDEIDAAERDLAQARLQAAQAEADVDAAADAEAAARAALAELRDRAAALHKELGTVDAAIASNDKKLAWAVTERKNAKSTVTELARHVAAAERALARLSR